MIDYPITSDELKKLLRDGAESENLEFKTARNSFSKTNLFDYVSAIANEGGGKLMLGVTDDHKIVGSNVYLNSENKIPNEILQNINVKVYIQSLLVDEKRVVVIFIPKRPIGRPVSSCGKYRYPMRVGESLVEMNIETLQSIFSETDPDFSSKTIESLQIDCLNQEALKKFRLLWSKKQNRKEYLNFSFSKMLRSLNLATQKSVSHTALILFGKKEFLNKYMPDAEIIFEWRQNPNQTNYDFRQTWREPFILAYDQIWDVLNLRNIKYSYQEGFVQRDLKAFDEKPFREALLNAVSHRDYKMKGHSIFIKASPSYCEIESPGGLISGITLNNILYKTAWRNRLLAESLEKAGLVERSGQGLDDIYEISIRNGKGSPVLEEIYSSSFIVTIPAKIKDKYFVKFLESVSPGKEFSFEEIIELEKVRQKGKIDKVKFKDIFMERGILEKVGRGKTAKYILAHKYYKGSDQTGVYTRLVGISREKYKELILKHIKREGEGKAKEFRIAFPELASSDISNFLRELKLADKIIFVGENNSGVWKLKM